MKLHLLSLWILLPQSVVDVYKNLELENQILLMPLFYKEIVCLSNVSFPLNHFKIKRLHSQKLKYFLGKYLIRKNIFPRISAPLFLISSWCSRIRPPVKNHCFILNSKHHTKFILRRLLLLFNLVYF